MCFVLVRVFGFVLGFAHVLCAWACVLTCECACDALCVCFMFELVLARDKNINGNVGAQTPTKIVKLLKKMLIH